MENGAIQKAYDQCLKYISFKNRTEQEIVLYLEKKEYDERIIAAVMEKLIRYKFINDEEYLKHYCYTNINFGYNGRIKMRYDLKKRGIPDKLLFSLDDLFTEEQEWDCCKKQYQKAEKKYDREPYLKRKSKIYGFLQRKGFASEMIKTMIENNLVREDDVDLTEEETEWLMKERMTEAIRYYEKYKRTHENKGYQGYELKQRIIRSLMGRGYSYDLIKKMMDSENENEE
ncbi:MAG: RecX family transcriptional regulator [Eubacterium sp.]